MTPGFFISTHDAFKFCIFPRKEDLKEINPEYSLEGLMLKVKLQSFGHLM